MARIWDEKLEGTGYEETWSLGETVGAGSTLDEDAAPPAGVPASWGAQSLQAVIAAGEQCYVAHSFADGDPKYLRVEFMVTQEGLTADGQVFYLLYCLHALTNVVVTVAAGQVAGVLTLILQDDRDGDGAMVTAYSEALSLNTVYRLEVRWDLANTTVAWRLNGSEVASGTLSGAATGWHLNDMAVGTPASSTGAQSTAYFDLIAVDNADWVGSALIRTPVRTDGLGHGGNFPGGRL